MQELHITVNNKIATYMRRDGSIVCGNSSYMVVFSFDEEWDAYETKTARFLWNNLYTDVPFTGNTVKAPIVRDTTLLKVGVYAGELSTTTPATIRCKKSILCGMMHENPEKDEPPVIPEGYIYPTGTAVISKNGEYDVREYATAFIDVKNSQPTLRLQEEKTATKNGVVLPDAGYDGLKKVKVAVPLGSLSVDSNGIYLPPEGVDGFSRVKVNLTESNASPFFANVERVDSVAEMTDTSKIYILNSTNTIWRYKVGGAIKEMVEERITGTWATGRLGSNGSISTGYPDYVVTPYIDLAKYTVPFELHLKGIPFSNQHTSDGYNTYCHYDKNQNCIGTRNLTNVNAFETFWSSAVLTDNGDGTCVIKFTPPIKSKGYADASQNGIDVGYARFTGKGTEANANVYITYETEVEGGDPEWVDTGIGCGEYVPEASFQQVNYDVGTFMSSAPYRDGDYTYTQVPTDASKDPRKDIPKAYVLEWGKVENAIMYVVSIDKQTYYTEANTLSVSNFIPDTTYSYSVYALCEGGSMVAVQNGSFRTTADHPRMLNIDGIQNVRDIGGYTGKDGKQVEYGLIYRGSAMDELVGENYPCFITEAGKKELVERVGIKTDIDLRDERYVTTYVRNPLGAGVDYYNRENESYLSYVDAVTKTAGKEYFAEVFGYIVGQLDARKPVYIHCSGGCDRTGTLVFLLLGLLGVNESDLAKEYELSSFSKVGYKRHRNSTDYNYSGMVAEIKKYNGATFTDNFVLFAADCGIKNTTLNKFRSIMLG